MADYYVDLDGNITKKKKKSAYSVSLDGKVTENDDIAPVRSDRDKADLFGLDLVQSGTFSDGYQIGDVTKSILGTAGDLGLEVVKGAGGLVEGVADLIGYAGAGVADLFGADDYADRWRKSISKSQMDQLTKGADDWLEQYSLAGNTLDAVGQGVGQVGTLIATGGLASSGLGATLLTTGLMGASGVGSGMSEAYQNDATDEEALTYGLISGAADAFTEMIFGGLGKSVNALGFGRGLSSADDMLAKTVSNKFKSTVAKNIAEFGIKAGAEGLEEVLAGTLQAAGKKATYMSEADWNDLIADENLFEQFVVGAMTSGIAQAGSVKTANKTGRDFITGLTQNEQTVVDSLYESEIADKDLDKKEKQKIYDQILTKLDKGYISTDAIESALGGESYKAYKDTLDSETALKDKLTASQKEYNELKGIHWKERSQDQNSRLAELETEIKTLEAQDAETTANSKLKEMKSQLYDKVYNLTKNDTKLQESYREIARRGQDLELDAEKYKGAAKITAQNILKGGMNNTNRVHDVVNFLTKISADKNIVFDVATAQKLAEAGLAVDGKQVNGLITKDGIVLNLESNAVLETTVGHEITHALEGTEHYEVLKEAIREYAELKGVYADKYSSLESIYAKKDAKGNILKDENGNIVWIRDDVDIDSEIVADLVGEYLFTDADFINNLSVKHRNVFQKIYDEIKYLVKIATAGSEEARKLEEVKRAFDKAYKQDAEVDTAEYADNEVKYSIREEAPPKETGIAYKVFFVKDGKLYPPMVANPDGADTPMGVWLNADVGKSAPPSKTGRQQVKAGGKGTQGGGGSLAFRPGWHLGDLPRASQFDRVNPETGKKELFPENFVWAEVEYAKDVDYQEEAMSYGYTENGKFRHAYAGLPRLPENGYYRYRTNPKPDTVPWIITGAMKVNRLLSDAEVNEILAKNGVEPVHRQGGDVGLEKFGVEGDVKYSLGETTDGRFVAVVDNDLLKNIDTSSWDKTKKASAQKAAFDALKNFSNGIVVDGITRKVNLTSRKEYTRSKDTERLYKKSPDVFADKMRVADVADDIVVATTDWSRDGGLKHPRTDNFVDFDHGKTLIMSGEAKYIAEVVVGITDTGDAVFYDVVDMTPTTFDIKKEESPTTVTTQDAPDSIYGDSTATKVPQDAEKVNGKFSLSSDSEGRQLSKEQSEYFKDSKVVDENGSLKVVYHGTRKADFTVFKRNVNFFTDSKEMADSYSPNGEMYEGYVNITKPYEIDAMGEKWSKIPIDDATKNFLQEYGASVFKEGGKWRTTPADIASAIEEAVDNGDMDYDGIIIRNIDDTGSYYKGNDKHLATDYITFKSNQFKNADNNAPTSDPDIRYSLSAETDKTYLDAVNRGDMETAQMMVYEAAKVAGYTDDSSWKMQHTAPNSKDDVSLYNLKESGLVPSDYWDHPEWYTYSLEEKESFYKVKKAIELQERRKAEGSPRSATMMVYRAVDKTANKREDFFRNGDWVTPSYDYAINEGRMNPNGYRIIKQIVPIKDLYWDGNSIAELGYDDGNTYAYADTANNRKLLDPVTYDEFGNVIPLSKRFNRRNWDVSYSISDPNDIAPVDFQKSARYLMVQKDNIPGDIAPMTEAEANALQSEKTKMADAEPPVEEEPKKLTRSELHKQIIGKMKHAFQACGLDFDEVLRKAKNLSTFATVDNTPQRVMEKALGYKEGKILSDLTVNKVAQNETEGIKWLNSVTGKKNGLLAELSKRYNIKPGSKESAAAQMYAEGFYVDDNNDIIAYGDAELAKDFPDAQVQNRIKGLARDPRIRQFYDETLEMINQSRTRNAYPEIPRLDNYFLHFRAMDDTFSKLGLPFNPNDIRAKDLPTDLNGVTADLKPGQPYFASAMHRKGKRTSFDLLGGLERYASSAKNQIYHIDDIQNFRALRNYLADNFGQAHGLENIDTMTEEEAQQRIEEVFNSHLSTFAKFLNEEANVLAGKTALIDRGIEGIIGRRGITFLDTLNKQVGSNMVGYNVSSAMTNFDALFRGFAKSNKYDFLKAFTQYTSNKIGSAFGKGDGFAENNPTIIRRNGADRFSRTPWQKMGDAGYALMGVVDNISTEILVRAKYNELTRNGMSEQQAVVETDKWVSRLMGDRSLGQQPLLFNSKMLGLVTKFQLEVRNNLDSMFYDTIQEAKVSNEEIVNAKERNAKTAAKITSTMVQTAVAMHLFGKAFESIAGYNPTFDIVSVLATLFGFDDEEESEDTALDNMEQAFLELLEDLPYTSTFTGGRIPIGSALPIEQLLTGKDQYGNEKSRVETIAEAAPYYLLPGGYGQIKKTTQGLGMFSDDLPIAGSYTDSGNLRFPVEDTPINRLQAGIFGQYASANARDYFDNNRTALKEKQIQEFIDVDIPIRDYWEYREGLSEQKTIEDKFDYIAGLDLPVSKKNILINNVVDRQESVDLEGYEDFSDYEEFDFATKNPEKYTVAKAVGGYNSYASYYKAMNDISADKDENGKSITGSRKEKIIDYVNSLDIDYGMKIILFKSEYKADDTYNADILDYLNSRNDLTYDEIVTILTELDFTVDAQGNVYWD